MSYAATFVDPRSEQPAALARERSGVHVWRVPLDNWSYADHTAFAALLSADEQTRAERFHFPQHRDRFIVAHGVLHLLLGRYLKRHPADLHFRYGPYGKPALAGADAGLHFNLSHSHQLALIALTYTGELGIDIEYWKPLPDLWSLARQCFAPDELAALESLPDEQRLSGFYNAWTRKEALIKAHGDGLALNLKQFAVTLEPGAPARLVYAAPADLHRWRLYALDPGPHYSSALACAGPGSNIACFNYSS